MNFFAPTLPLADWTDVLPFALVLGIVGLLPLGMWLWIRRRGWT
jgi:Mg2+ and Co2+ transporter CorA